MFFDRLGDIYVWDFASDEKEANQFKEQFYSILKNRPEPKACDVIILNSEKRPERVTLHWNYILDSKKEVLGFLSLMIPWGEKSKAEAVLHGHQTTDFMYCSDCPKKSPHKT